MTFLAPRSQASTDAGVYRYDEIDRAFVHRRVEQFRDQVDRRLAGELSEDEFKPFRLMNGLYLQLHAYMLRVAIPYGVLSADQLRRLGGIARRWDRGLGHVTTRQNLQLNWIALEDTPAILAELADFDMHAIQTSGNCIRNVTTDPFAGAARDEVVDPRLYAEVLRQWSSLHPEFSFLPRKFKIAIVGSAQDRAALRVHDVGLLARRAEDGRIGFTVFAGGGLGRTPMIGREARAWLEEEDLIAYLEAILRVYNRWGRRDNIYKARIKILVHELGIERFTAEVEEEFQRIQGPRFRLEPELLAEIRRHFQPPPFASDADTGAFARAKAAEPAFAAWAETNLHPHKVPGYASLTISLKPPGGVPGDITSEQMEAVADLADRHAFGEVRVTHTQNLVFAHVRLDDLVRVWRGLVAAGLASANAGLISDIIACPGMDYCALASARSIPLAQALSQRFAEPNRARAIGDCSIKISGCVNACGHHHIGAIGILGVDKKGEETYQITLGGSAEADARIGEIIGPALSAEATVDAVETLVDTYLERRQPGERFLATLARLGRDPFKEALNAAR